MITPAFAGDELIGFAANRAHHADVGGPTPGSMPADSKTLYDEGVVIEPQRLDEDAIERLADQMRQPAQRRADLRAQLAANRTGVNAPEGAARADAARRRRWRPRSTTPSAARGPRSRTLDDGTREAKDVLEAADGDLTLCLKATVEGDELHLDFTGTADQHEGNLNCPLAVTVSACWFAVRVLTDPDIPPSQRRHAAR